MASKIGSKADKNGKIYKKIYKMMASGEVNIISYGAPGSAPCRPVSRYIHSFSFTNNLMTQLPDDYRVMPLALCALLLLDLDSAFGNPQSALEWANLFKEDPKSQYPKPDPIPPIEWVAINSSPLK